MYTHYTRRVHIYIYIIYLYTYYINEMPRGIGGQWARPYHSRVRDSELKVKNNIVPVPFVTEFYENCAGEKVLVEHVIPTSSQGPGVYYHFIRHPHNIIDLWFDLKSIDLC